MEDLMDKMRRTSPSKQSFPVKKRPSVRLGSQEKKIADDEFMAAAIGDVEWLKQSLRGVKGTVNFDKNGLAPIHLASIHGRLECLQLLVEKMKVDINLASSTGWRPLHLVICNSTGKRAFQCLQYLLQQGADPEVTNDDAITPMHQAASEGHVQCLKALVEAEAKVGVVDYRGHKPIDLAKLWGHRKCARLLAAEQWHQEKDFLSSEMNQLQKLKMQQVLREIEADEENKAHQEFYGNLAFNEWLENRGLDRRPTGPPSATRENDQDNPEMGARIRSAPRNESKQIANSAQRKPGARTQATPKQGDRPRTEPKSRTMDTMPTQVKSPHLSSRGQTSVGLSLNSREMSQAVGESRQDSRSSSGWPLSHPLPWNKSSKLPQKEYLPLLDDHYPRDEFSMLPKHQPKRMSRTPTMVVMDTDGSDGQSAKSRAPNLPSDVINKALDPKSYERPVVYKCKHIGDVHNKKHWETDVLPKCECGMHLTSDFTSLLFKSSLQPGLGSRNQSGSSTKMSDAAFVVGPDSKKDFAAWIKQMNKPTYYPDVKGPEYDLNLGQLVSI